MSGGGAGAPTPQARARCDELSGLLVVATIEPAVDFARLEQVFVMLRRGPTMDLLYASSDGDEQDPADPR